MFRRIKLFFSKLIVNVLIAFKENGLGILLTAIPIILATLSEHTYFNNVIRFYLVTLSILIMSLIILIFLYSTIYVSLVKIKYSNNIIEDVEVFPTMTNSGNVSFILKHYDRRLRVKLSKFINNLIENYPYSITKIDESGKSTYIILLFKHISFSKKFGRFLITLLKDAFNSKINGKVNEFLTILDNISSIRLNSLDDVIKMYEILRQLLYD